MSKISCLEYFAISHTVPFCPIQNTPPHVINSSMASHAKIDHSQKNPKYTNIRISYYYTHFQFPCQKIILSQYARMILISNAIPVIGKTAKRDSIIFPLI